MNAKNNKNKKKILPETVKYQQPKAQKGDSIEFKLKISNIQNQLYLLNEKISQFITERDIKLKFLQTLKKQRIKLENSSPFLCSEQSKNYSINKFVSIVKDVNIDINEYEKKIQNQMIQINKNTQNSFSDQSKDVQNQNKAKMSCQTRHLYEIFNAQQQNLHIQKLNRLKMRRDLIYQKIRLTLQKQQPYIFEKIVERIKRHVNQNVRYKLNIEIDKKIQNNSIWINQQQNKINNKLNQKQVEEIIKSNLELMKKIMNKKIQNNDFIFQNYVNLRNNEQFKGVKSKQYQLKQFPVSKIRENYQKILKKIEQMKINLQYKSTAQNQKSRQKGLNIENLINSESISNLLSPKYDFFSGEIIKKEEMLLKRCQQLRQQIDKLN